MSTPTVSTKLPKADRDRLVKAAESQGKTVSAFLQGLIQEYLQSGGKAGEPAPKSRPPSGVDKGLPHKKTRSDARLPQSPLGLDTLPDKPKPDVGLPSEYHISYHHHTPTKPKTPTSEVDTERPSSVSVVDPPSLQSASPKYKQSWWGNTFPDRHETLPSNSSGINWGVLLLLGLLYLGLRSRS